MVGNRRCTLPSLQQEDAPMATVKCSLPDPMCRWLEAQITTGGYCNARDYVSDLIRRQQADQERREALIRALVAGQACGISERTLGQIWDRVKARHGLGQ
jgi:antitoxin ParD1/3/4